MDRRQFLWNFGGGLRRHRAGELRRVGALAERRDSISRQSQARGATLHVRRRQPVRHLRLQTGLIRRNGEKFDPGGKVELFQSSPGAVMKSPWEWKQHGQCGKWISDLVPHLASCADDIAFVHSMVAKSNVHGPATFMQNTGFVLPGFPCMGVVGLLRLGQHEPESADLRRAARFARLRAQRPGNWSAGFLPAATRAP